MGRDIIIEEEGIGGIVLYQTPDGQTNLEVKLENDTVWLTRQQMALLFGRDVKTIGKHINNALKEELAGELVVAKFATPKLRNQGRDNILTYRPYIDGCFSFDAPLFECGEWVRSSSAY